jgi:alanyl-tRNA synthetase/REP element-mobilizing transposase RayT
MMTSAQIRQSFLDFFKEKQHTIVPSDNVGYTSRDGARIFTNAGMNQFVPIFLGERPADVDTWPGVLHKGLPTRAADTQKCIRAGGKHNDLEDVGLDTYHHTLFEMLGNWSFGDYFKKEAISWAWELVIERWKFPPTRVFATIYQPGAGDPAERDQEAWDIWAEKFRSIGLDPDIHIVNGNKKDNFWMMGDTGPCGPCTEIHIDLTPGPRDLDEDRQRAGAKLVNGSDASCIEIWNNVFIQYNANPDGTFVPLPAQHVDTGMGFERVCSIIQGTKNFTDFENAKISNYDTDVFKPIFDELTKLSGKTYASTLPKANSQGNVVPVTDQEKIDVAFRVIADHIRTLSFAIADGIQPGNSDRNYTLRRILRRAVKYGRTLDFKEPFFYKLVDVLAAQLGGVFPELRAKKEQIKSVLKLEEEAFNRTLDKGIALFEEEATKLLGRAGIQPAVAGVTPGTQGVSPAYDTSVPTAGATRTKRRALPHFEKPWAIYSVTVSTRNHRFLSPEARTIVLDALKHFDNERYELIVACVMPDHFHFIMQPWPKEMNEQEKAVFWTLGDILHTVKGFSAKEINKLEGTTGSVWEEERYDRYIRSDADLEEKFNYILENPRRAEIVDAKGEYEWTWTRYDQAGETPCVSGGTPDTAAKLAALPMSSAISGAFAFRLYDEQGFPLDLTELMARERGLTVDTAGFDKLMEEAKEKSRAAIKKNVVSVSEIETKEATKFTGYDALEADAKVLEVVAMKDKTAVVLDASTFYAEMGGQVGDAGQLILGANSYPVSSTTKVGNTWLHFLEGDDAPEVGATVRLAVDPARRHAIERHHTVTHILHWALHEVVSKDATQKGSSVTPDKLTFDFNSGALTPQQLADIEKLVNERIVENDVVSWKEIPYTEAKANSGIMQLFGEKYPENVRVVQIGGKAHALDGYSMELCGGTHTRSTGEIGLFRLISEAAVAAGVRRIEAIAGLEAYQAARADADLIKTLCGKVTAQGAGDLEKKIEALQQQLKDAEKALKAAQQREAASRAKELLKLAENNSIIANLGDVDADYGMAVNDALKGQFSGVIVLATTGGGSVALFANVGKDHQAKVQAGKIIQTIAPLVGGKGGGKPDFARGGGKDVSKVEGALAEAKRLVG